MKRTCLIFAVAVILASNAIALIGVARNRAGEPFETIELTERELPLQIFGQDDSGVVLRLSLSPDTMFGSGPLDRTQLEAAGFDTQFPAGLKSSDIALLPRPAYVALEYEGAAWEKWLQQTPDSKRQTVRPSQEATDPESLKKARMEMSHLFLVGASGILSELRARYPDQSRYLIVRAVLMVRLTDEYDSKTKSVTGHNVVGHVTQILPPMINVPLPQAKLLSSLQSRTGQEPRYSVTLKYGRNLEPWVVTVRIH